MILIALHTVDQFFIDGFLAASTNCDMKVDVYDSNEPLAIQKYDIVITDRLQCQMEGACNVHVASTLTPKLVDEALSIGFVDVWSTEFNLEADLWARCCLIMRIAELSRDLAEEQLSSENLIDAFQTGKIERIPSSAVPSGMLRLVDEKLFEENQRLLRQIEKKNTLLEEMAHFDSLTGLPNRRMFTRHLKREVARSSRHGLMMALFFIDLDHFKEINDRLGHDVGDLILKETSSRQIDSVREEDIVCRIAGDEFAIILTDIESPEVAGSIAEKVIQALSLPYDLNKTTIHASASIGIACYPNAGETPDELNKNADIAMYRAKECGRNGYRFFTEAFNRACPRELDLSKKSN